MHPSVGSAGLAFLVGLLPGLRVAQLLRAAGDEIIQSLVVELGEVGSLLGDGLILAATLCWSLYTLISRRMLRDYPPIAVTSFSTVVGVIPLVLLAIPPLAQLDWAAISITAWGSLIFSGIFGITLAYFFWNYGVSRLGSARTSLYSNLTPPLSLFLAWLLLGHELLKAAAKRGLVGCEVLVDPPTLHGL